MNQPYPAGTPASPPPRTNPLSIVSLVTGILGVLTFCPTIFVPMLGFCGGPLSLAALVTGLISLSQVRKSMGREAGKGFAIAGTIQGAIVLLLEIVYAILFLLVLFGLLAIPFISNSIPNNYYY